MPRPSALILALLSLACAGWAMAGQDAEVPSWAMIMDFAGDPAFSPAPISQPASATASLPASDAALVDMTSARGRQADTGSDAAAGFIPPRLLSAPASRPDPAVPARGSPGLMQDASAVQMPDAPGHSRAPSVYAPYLSAAPAGDGNMDAAAVTLSLKARGFSDVSRPLLRGRSYLCEATGPRRERVRLVVDAASGAISGLEVIGYDGRRE